MTLFSDVATESSKTAAILSDNSSHTLPRNVSGPVHITCKSAEDNFNDTLKKLRIKNLNRVIISQINISSIRNKIELLLESFSGNNDILMVSETKIVTSDKSICHSGFCSTFQAR